MRSHSEWITVAAPAADRIAYQRLRLTVVRGPDAGARFEFADESVRVGALPSNDLTLRDPRVSGLHLEISVSPRGVRVRDPGSTNGTRVDGVRTSDAFLRRGSEIRIGDTVLILEQGEGAAEVELALAQSFGPLVGGAPSMRELYARIRKLAPSSAPMLILGETGSGKELVARAIHDSSGRAGEPFVPVECPAIPSALIESELFGYERGAFTGADHSFAGAFERAGSGTVLLDEIGDLPLSLQPKLLGVIERREVRRLGSNEARPVRARVIAATAQDVPAMVNRRAFRADLYYRLSVGQIRVPPLRERSEDIPLLVEYFLRALPDATPIDDHTMKLLVAHSWPGNVRELRNAVERIGLLGCVELGEHCVNPRWGSEAAPRLPVEIDLPYKEARDLLLGEFRELYASRALEKASGNISDAARRSGIDRMTLYRMLPKGATK